MVEYELKGRIVYVRRKTAGKVMRRLSIIANRLERDGHTVEAVTVWCTHHEADPWAGTVLVQEA
ncbi:hypothetical protein [Lentzea sp. NBRC 102530]|uniref:hypothetical protein n=1 Tax=Lentzea sp. NBRC 102530 TaxID=3032201 RepID=UPI002553A4AF|nr:hypothetical protein [Lentzea sp. NBRC 102530]